MIKSSKLVYKVLPGLAPDVQVIEQNRKKRISTVRVAAYCRVSTRIEEQRRSLENQIAIFRKTIAEHPGWLLAGIYADSGISGTSVRGREEFLRMIEDAKTGNVQYILVKSISRFARNTVDALKYVRELKKYGVSVFFENERIDTCSATSEFIISILAANAQEQILSLSNNMKVGIRMRYAAGQAPWKPLYGYRKDEDGRWVVHEGEAAVVRRIFREYLEGSSCAEIGRGLEHDRILSGDDTARWYPNRIALLLHNERYAGDIRMQKSYISDPIEHTRQNNRDARIRQYYMQNHHPAIIDRETYNMALTASTMKDLHRGIAQYPFYGFLKCPFCGQNMVRFSHPRSNYVFAWTCGGKPDARRTEREKRTKCPAYYVYERYIDQGFRAAVNEACKASTLNCSPGGAEENEFAETVRLLRIRLVQDEENIEYKLLCDAVDHITFTPWSAICVFWKNGTVSEAGISYRQVIDEPYPIITKDEPPHLLSSDGREPTGALTEKHRGRKKVSTQGLISAIMLVRNEVQALNIIEPKPYEAPIPMVFGSKTTSFKPAAVKAVKKARATRKKQPDSPESDPPGKGEDGHDHTPN